MASGTTRVPTTLRVFKKHIILKHKSFSKKYSIRLLTIRNTAAKSVILQRTSRSIGKVTPKLSESVNASLANPDHCFVIFPTSEPSFVSTLVDDSENHIHNKKIIPQS